MKLHDQHFFISSSNLFNHTTPCQVKLAVAGVMSSKLTLYWKNFSVGYLHGWLKTFGLKHEIF